MKKLILIGNGFDKAHDLKTGYGDFFDFILETIKSKDSRSYQDQSIIHFMDDDAQKANKYLAVHHHRKADTYELSFNPYNGTNIIYFKSLFQFRKANGYWSDLEYHYFKVLLENRDNPDAIKLINEEFEFLKNLLEKYLYEQVERDFEINLEYTYAHEVYKILEKSCSNYENIYFVSFNYTSKILERYLINLGIKFPKGKSIFKPIYVHGKLNSKSNPIIFGFGDDDSTDYQKIQLIQNNDLLENFKTFQYLRTNNYHNALAILEGDESIDIDLIGLSCGISDKTLLQNFFEHKNTRKIQAIYHNSEKKYFDLAFNISRIFKDNSELRRKLLPLTETIKLN